MYDGTAMTECPKCHYVRQNKDANIHAGVCPACGIAYQKWLERQQKIDGQFDNTDADYEESDNALLPRLKALLTEIPVTIDPLAFWSRAVTLAGVAVWTAWFIGHGIDWEIIGGSFMHNINLAFHEFGHVFFSPFGNFMMILGGSLFQILLPLIPLVAFVIQQRDNFAAAVMLWWCGQSFIDIAPYIRDAEYRALPLVGGASEDFHDWGNILTRLDAVSSCYALAKTSFTIGCVIMLAGVLWGSYILLLQYRAMDENSI
jgi:hypothetical protein